MPAIGWAIAIYIFSTHAFSASSTSRFIVPLLQWLMPGAKAAEIYAAHELVRKIAHFVEFFILSALVFRGFRGPASGWRFSWSFWTVALAIGYAALDEVHQMFVPSRGASTLDVAIDGVGAIVAQFLIWLYFRLPRRRGSCVS